MPNNTVSSNPNSHPLNATEASPESPPKPTALDEKELPSTDIFDLSLAMDEDDAFKGSGGGPFRMPVIPLHAIHIKDTRPAKAMKALAHIHHELWVFVCFRKLPMPCLALNRKLRSKCKYWNLPYEELLLQFENLYAIPLITARAQKWYLPRKLWLKLEPQEQDKLVAYCDREDALERERHIAVRRKAFEARERRKPLGRPRTLKPVFNTNTNDPSDENEY